MNKNIDLGTFEWDISKIEQQIIENRKQMEAFSGALAVNKKALSDEKKEIQSLAVEISTMKALQKDANLQLKAGTLTQEEYNQAMEDSNKVIEINETRIREVASAQSAHIKTILDHENAVKGLRNENAELNKLLSAGRTEITGNEHAYRDLNKELNALKIETKNIGAEMLNLERAGKKDTEEYRRLAAQFAETSTKANELNDEFKAIDKSVGDNQRTVGDYTDSIKKAFGDIPGQIASGDIKGAISTTKEGLGSLFDMIKANPWLLVLTGIAAFVKEMSEYNAQTKELNATVEQLANTSGATTDELRKNALAIQETYGKDFGESVKELSALMNDFNISADEAFKIYNEGLAAGGAQNAEFGDSIREYGPLFAQNGYDAQQFVNILNSGIDLGIYSDKLPDAVKEAGIALKEQTKSTRDALVNAFGATFADDILRKVQSGEITVADALERISEKAEDANLNQQQLAQLTADVFKGAGEDAGGALVIFQAINNAQEIQYDNLTDLEKAVVNLADKNRELSDAKDEAFKSDSVITFQQTVNNVWKDIQISWYKYLGNISKNTQKEIDFLKLIFLNVKDSIVAIPQAFSIIMGGLNKDFKQLAAIGSSVGNIFANLFHPDELKKSVDTLFAQVNNFTSFTKQSIGDVAEMTDKIATKNRTQIEQQRKATVEAAKAQAAAEKLLSGGNSTGSIKEAETKAAAEAAKAKAKAEADAERARKSAAQTNSKKVTDAKKTADDAAKAAADAAKKQLEIQKQNADLSYNVAKTELAEYIANNAAKLDSDKRLNADRIAEQVKYFEELQSLGMAEIAADREKALIGKTEEEKNQIRREYAVKETELTNQTNEKKAEIHRNYAKQTAEDERLSQEIAFQQKLIDLEEQGATEWQLRNEQAAEQREIDLEQLENDRENALISTENYEARKKLIESTYAAESKKITKDVDEFKLQSRAQVLGGLADLFGRESVLGKVFAGAEIINNTAMSAQKTFAQAAVFAANPLTAPLAPNAYLQGGIIIATGAAQLAKLVAPKPKAARGMVIRGNSHLNGGVDISTPSGTIEAEGGEPILTKKAFQMFPRLISDINVAGGGVPLFAAGGLVPSRTSSVQRSLRLENTEINLSPEAIEAVATAIYAGSQQGIGDMADNRKIANGANF